MYNNDPSRPHVMFPPPPFFQSRIPIPPTLPPPSHPARNSTPWIPHPSNIPSTSGWNNPGFVPPPQPELTGFQFGRPAPPIQNISRPPHPPPECQTNEMNVGKSQEELDNERLQLFLQQFKGRKKPEKEPDTSIKISEARHMHSRSYQLIDLLKKGENEESRAELKAELDKILEIMQDETVISTLNVKLTKRAKKRERNRIKKREAYEQKLEKEKRIQERHIETDNWLKKKRKIEEDLQREKRVQKELDEYLKEVRHKQSSAQKYLDLFNALAKLREARAAFSVKKGESPSDYHSKVFSEIYETASKDVQAYISKNKKEEKFMRKYATEEQEAEQRKIDLKNKKEEEERISEWKRQRFEVLFGSEENSTSDPPSSLKTSPGAQNRTLLELAATRSEWDQYISETGERNPTYWVEPSPPSSAAWEEFLSK